jgi:NhaA family Na+:H+ antiporter
MESIKKKAEVNNESRIIDRFIMPLQHFMQQERSGGIVLGLSIIVAVIIANTPLSDAFFNLFQLKFGFTYNGQPFFNYSLHHWIDDGLMAIFFFVVGLELKREFIGGELSDIRNTILPIGAAVGGMVVPALIYMAFNHSTPQASGWGIPMATDIAFAMGVLFLLGKRVPLSIKVFLTTLAVVDDLGSVIVIALFYTSEISLISLLTGFLFLLVMFVANKMGVKNVIFYGLVGIVGVWTAFLMSGVHATIAAVLAAFMIPADSIINEDSFFAKASRQLTLFKAAKPNNVSTLEDEQLQILSKIREDTRDAIPPLQRLERALHPFVSFVIMPIFALSSAGICFSDINVSTLFSTNVAIGVALGLLLGKPIGIIGTSLLLMKFHLAPKPSGMTLHRLIGVGFVASIGFTMSMFISTLAFPDVLSFTQAKIGIFAASILGGIIGYVLLKNSK